MALSTDRNTPERAGALLEPAVKGSTTIYAGALVCRDANGYAVPGSEATTLKPLGRAEERVVNGGADGAVRVRVRPGIFRWKNSASADAITAADVGNDCYVVDDETVAKTNGTNTRSRAGVVVDVDAQGVWVTTGPGF